MLGVTLALSGGRQGESRLKVKALGERRGLPSSEVCSSDRKWSPSSAIRRLSPCGWEEGIWKEGS